MTTISPQQPQRHSRGSVSVTLFRPTKPKEGTVWSNPATGLDEIYSSGLWKVKTSSGNLLVTSNLSDVANTASARTNLGLGTWATQNTTATPTHTMVEGGNLVLGTTTGTKFGTVGGASGQKIGFFNATPIVQPLLATGAAHTVDDIITVLQNLGLVRQS